MRVEEMLTIVRTSRVQGTEPLTLIVRLHVPHSRTAEQLGKGGST